MDDKAPVRPTSDKARGALFSSIAALVHGSRVLDICAGTGAVGLEALSRGALHVTAVEQAQRAIDLLKLNANALGVDPARYEIMRGDFRSVLGRLAGRQFDIIFADPPYEQGLLISVLEQVWRHNLLADNGVMVMEHFAKEEPPEASADLVRFKVKKYGQTTMTFYRKGEIGDE